MDDLAEKTMNSKIMEAQYNMSGCLPLPDTTAKEAFARWTQDSVSALTADEEQEISSN
jgi:hypothetical protein